MSYDLEILSETSYQNFLNQLNNNLSYEEIEEFFDEAVSMTRTSLTVQAPIVYSTLSTKQKLIQMNSQRNSSTTCIACVKIN